MACALAPMGMVAKGICAIVAEEQQSRAMNVRTDMCNRLIKSLLHKIHNLDSTDTKNCQSG